MKKSRKRKLKILLMMASVLLLMLALSGCRTRLTNNTEVNPTITDEDGWLQESYDMRRDALGSPVAKKPFLTGSPEDEEDDYDVDYDFDTSTEQEPDEPEPPEETDEDDDKDTKTTTTSKTTKTTKKPGTTKKTSKSSTKKKSNKNSGKTDAQITVTLDTCGGTPPTLTQTYSKGATYGELPGAGSVTRGNDQFVGWYTEKDGGSEIKFNDPVPESGSTIYAHWNPQVDPTPTKYTITLDLDGGTLVTGSSPFEITNGFYPDPLPTAKKDNYYLDGWFSGEKRILPGSECTGDSAQTLKAKWLTYSQYWNNRYDTASNKEEFTDTFYSEDGLDFLLKGEKVEADKNPKYVIVSTDDFINKAQGKAEETSSKYKGSKIIVVEKDPDDNKTLLYKLMLLKELYGDPSTITDEELTQVAKDLGLDPKPQYLVYTPEAEGSA